MLVYDPTELSRGDRVATVQRSLRRLHHAHCQDAIQIATLSGQLPGFISVILYAQWCHLVFIQASRTTAVVIEIQSLVTGDVVSCRADLNRGEIVSMYTGL